MNICRFWVMKHFVTLLLSWFLVLIRQQLKLQRFFLCIWLFSVLFSFYISFIIKSFIFLYFAFLEFPTVFLMFKVAGVQCLSGTGSLKAGADFLHIVSKLNIVYISKPTWFAFCFYLFLIHFNFGQIASSNFDGALIFLLFLQQNAFR